MERQLDKSNTDLQQTRIISERNSDIMHTLKLSYDILLEKYTKSENLLNQIRSLSEKLSNQELLDLIGEAKTDRSSRDHNIASEQVIMSPLGSRIAPGDTDTTLKHLQNDLKQKLELLALRDK